MDAIDARPLVSRPDRYFTRISPRTKAGASGGAFRGAADKPDTVINKQPAKKAQIVFIAETFRAHAVFCFEKNFKPFHPNETACR
jgi:hypothetical protein